MIDFLEEVAPADSVLAKTLSDYKAQGNLRDYYLLHEELEPFNSPCYLIEMVARAQANGLAYLADATPQTMFATNYGDKVAEPLLKECGHSQVLLEQYLDFVVNRTFRQSLVVHAERAPQIRYTLDRNRNARLHFAAGLPPLDDRAPLDDSTQDFGVTDQALTTAVPMSKPRWKRSRTAGRRGMSRQELLDTVRARLSSAGIAAADNQETAVDDLLEYLIVHGQARYRLDPVPHESVPLSPTDRHLLPLLDGSHDRDALIEALLAAARAGLLQFERDDKPLSADADIRDASAEHVDTLGERLTAMKLWREVEARRPRFRWRG